MNIRKTTQSMYQSKMPTSTKLINASNIFNNSSKFNHSHLPTNTKMHNNSSIRKVEGQDMGQSGFKTTKTNFQQTFSNLKNKPTPRIIPQDITDRNKIIKFQLRMILMDILPKKYNKVINTKKEILKLYIQITQIQGKQIVSLSLISVEEFQKTIVIVKFNAMNNCRYLQVYYLELILMEYNIISRYL